MKLDEILTIIDKVSNSSLSSFSFEEGNIKINMEAKRNVIHSDKKETYLTEPVLLPYSEPAVSEDTQGRIITSPLVGIYYEAPGENAEPFVSVGDTVRKGQVVGIVEAMKLMNEVECEFDGVVAEILVSNEQMVEYGQPLIRVK